MTVIISGCKDTHFQWDIKIFFALFSEMAAFLFLFNKRCLFAAAFSCF